MSDLPKFMLKPHRSGYGFALSTGVVSTQTQAGMPRQRRSQVGVVHHLSVTYKCTRPMWQYMLSFLRANAGRAFMAYLLLDDIDHHWYECRYTDEQINVSTLGNQIFTAKLTLVVKPRPVNVGQDELIALLYSMKREEQDAYFNQLEKLVNADLPKIRRT
ncbi:hypothetical protein [Moraxella nasicaprae]|uniref:IDEAL domain-containing protein n=1 Tax=Moraxella nasicaprae TaxID=2904122 RepID=A0ABY6F3H7_9GAMM|nr:hypothetical protein [Moraxella nasicaprae]UXZ04547.1 hypothetical protein LU297_08170 [Moraxella nasicaprae]